MSDIYLSLTETPAVVTLSQPVISGALASTVTVANTVTVALDANSLSALENVTVTIGSLPAISGTVTANLDVLGLYFQYPNTFVVEDGGTENNFGVQIGFKTNNGTEPVLVKDTAPLPISGSVTIGSLPAISGTVTANVGMLGMTVVTSMTFASSGNSPVFNLRQLRPNTPIFITGYFGGGTNNIYELTQGSHIGGGSLVDTSTVTLKKYPQLSAVTTFNSTIGRDGMTERYGEGLSYNRDFRFTKISGATGADITATVYAIDSDSFILPSPISGTVTVEGTVTANSPNGALTTRFGTPTTANTAFATSAVTNGSRKYLLIQNVTTQSNVITVGIGFTPTTTQGIQLTAGAGITFESSYIPTGAVMILSSVTASNFTVLEA